MDQIAKLQKYMQTPEAKKKSDAAKDKAWTQFINEFPNADATKFVSQVSIDDNNNFSAEVFFKAILVPMAFSLASGRGGKRPFPSPPPSQGKGPSNEVVINLFHHKGCTRRRVYKTHVLVCKQMD